MTARTERRLTGWHVLAILLGSFAIVFAVNGVMVYDALSTFGGVETKNAYATGLAFAQDEAAARTQAALGWHVDGKVAREPDGTATVEIRALDRTGQPLAGLVADVSLDHVTDARHDHVLVAREVVPGVYRASATGVAAGQWQLQIDLLAGETRKFRSKNRIVLD